ncbi:DUF2007 domain-containing protein [Ferrimonas lipolytica]|uniref:DUF2007 domain-containing protein n=1 Tax=Ferrimonas lipolytica TaxID=2724191 RepID=A0A6H1UGU3_9GAMM|nr:DUF2007 domain-containing protein [Ferrimonas lipolytica]QIZ77012.1 DUF2007 domain-containing protein [Ferrimonas lipolytica]
MDSYVELFRASNSIEANAVKGMLEQQGILVRLLGEALGGAAGELPVDAQQIRLLVQRCHITKAQQIMVRYQQTMAPWQCVDCHEQNDGHFELCWNCGSEPVN